MTESEKSVSLPPIKKPTPKPKKVGKLDVDSLIRVESREITPPYYQKSEYRDVVRTPLISNYSKHEKTNKVLNIIKDEDEINPEADGITKRGMKHLEEKTSIATINIIAQAVQVWLFGFLKVPFSNTERIKFDLLNKPKATKFTKNKSTEESFLRLRARVEGIMNHLLDQTINLPEIVRKLLKRVFKENSFIPL